MVENTQSSSSKRRTMVKVIRRRMTPRMTIGVKFLSLVVLVALLAGGIVGMVTIKTSRDELRKQVLQDNLAEANLAADLTSHCMKSAQLPVQVLAARADIREAVLADNPEKLHSTLAEFVQTQTVLQACAIFDFKGIQRVSSLAESAGIGQSFADREWFQQAVATGRPFQSVPIISRAGNKPSSPYAVPILDDQGQVIGVITGSIYPDALSDVIVNINYGTNSRATLVDIRDGGIILADRDHQLDVQPLTGDKRFTGRLLAGERGMIETTGSSGESQLIGFAPVPDLPWSIMIVTPSASALAIIRSLTSQATLSTVFISLLAALLGIILVLGITVPIRRLVKGTQEIGRGNLDFKIAVKDHDEIGDLSRAFSSMTATLKNTLVSRDKLAQEVAERLKAEETLKKHWSPGMNWLKR